MQWLQNPNQINVVNLNNVRNEASRHFRNKNKKHQKAKHDEFGTNRKIKKIRHFFWASVTLRRATSPELI
jgi:hypothetical protein